LERGKSSLPSFSAEQAKEFGHIFKFLNNKDRDILFLMFISRLKQNHVQKILNRSQPSLCYDIRRIRKRLQFIHYLHQIRDIYLNFLDIKGAMYDPEILEILTLMFYTTSLTCTSKILRQQQIKIRYKYEKAIKQLEKNKHWDVYEIFSFIHDNLNIVRRFYKK
jgi:hypothetical protein